MIAVEMAKKNRIQVSGVQACSFHSQQSCRPAIHEEVPVGGFHEIAALVAAAATERVSTTENMNFHFGVPLSSVCE